MNSNTVLKDQEPNPFEQSFSSVQQQPIKTEHYNPPKIVGKSGIIEGWVSDISGYAYDANSMNSNDNYSVSNNEGTTTSDDSDDASFNNSHRKYERHAPNDSLNGQQYQQQSKSSNKGQRKRARTNKLPEDGEKRKNFLERNRLAALKCRQRKKQWLSNLQERVEFLTNDNDQLQMEVNAFRREIMDLKTLLVTHKNCPQYNSALSKQTVAAGMNFAPQPVYHQDLIMKSEI